MRPDVQTTTTATPLQLSSSSDHVGVTSETEVIRMGELMANNEDAVWLKKGIVSPIIHAILPPPHFVIDFFKTYICKTWIMFYIINYLRFK